MHHLSPSRAVALALAIATLVLPPRALYAEIDVVPIVRGGDAAPGATAGVTFSDGNFIDLQINRDGTIMFGAGLTGPGVTQQNRSGIWIGRPGRIELVVRTGDAAPETGSDAVFAFLSNPVLGADGSGAFYARVSGTGISEDGNTPGNDDTIWTIAPPDAAELTTSPPPHANRIVRARLRNFMIAGLLGFGPLLASFVQKDVEFAVFLILLMVVLIALVASEPDVSSNLEANGDETRFGLVRRAQDGTPALVAVTGDSAPGLADDLLSLLRTSVVASETQLAFTGSIAAGQAIWLGAPDGLAPVALPGSDVPQTLAAELGQGATYAGVGTSLSLNADGEIAFAASVVAGSASTSALVAGDSQAPRLVAQTLASGSPDDGFTQLGDIVINAEADVAFIASHTELGGIPGLVRGLWVTSGLGDPVLALGEGRTAPGLEQGEVVSFLEEGPFMNARGQVAMRAGIGSAAGFENTVDKGIWLIDPVAGIELVARSGASMDVGDGERLLNNVSLITSHSALRSGGEDGRVNVLNDLGQLVFQAHWQEPGAGAFRSGIFMATDACAAATCRDVDTVCKSCGQPVGQGASPTASDALAVLRVAVGTSSCSACVCDVDGSGSVAATDALITLKKAVGQGVTLACPA